MFRYSSPKLFKFFAIVIIALLCLIFDQLTKINFKFIELPKTQPEYNIDALAGRVYDKDGKLLYVLTGHDAWKYPYNDKLYLNMADLQIYDAKLNKIKYTLTSKNAWFDYNEKIGQLGAETFVVFYDQNSLVTNATNKDIKHKESNNITLSGKNILFNTVNNIFNSDDTIIAKQNKNSIIATGFKYDYNNKILILKSKVKIVYVQ